MLQVLHWATLHGTQVLLNTVKLVIHSEHTLFSSQRVQLPIEQATALQVLFSSL